MNGKELVSIQRTSLLRTKAFRPAAMLTAATRLPSQKIREAQEKGDMFAQSSPTLRTWVHGFEETFGAWRASVGPEEQTLIHAQAEGELIKGGFGSPTSSGRTCLRRRCGRSPSSSRSFGTKELLQKQYPGLCRPWARTSSFWSPATELTKEEVAKLSEGRSDEEMEKLFKEKVPGIGARTTASLIDSYVGASGEVKDGVDTLERFYRPMF